MIFMKLPKKLEPLVWSALAGVYDKSVSCMQPYKELVQRVANICAEHSVGNQTIVDTGCGTGNFSFALAANENYHIISVDYSREMLRIAEVKKRKFRKDNVEFRLGDLEAGLDFEDSSIDQVVNVHVFYMLEDSDFFLREAHRVLKPGGLLVMTTTQTEIDTKEYFASQYKGLKRMLEREGVLHCLSIIKDLAIFDAIQLGILWHGLKYDRYWDEESLSELITKTGFSVKIVNAPYFNNCNLTIIGTKK